MLDESTIQTAAIQHFEELAELVPNLNWSGEGSRARYFQIRGSGELEQYEGAPNASVGFIIDDIDFSALGGIATTFDTERVEVLRGPQGTRYGANALAGLIYVQTEAPPETARGARRGARRQRRRLEHRCRRRRPGARPREPARLSRRDPAIRQRWIPA